MRTLYTIALIITLVLTAKSQSISIFDIDSTNYPIMKAKVLAFNQNNQLVDLNLKDLKLTENGKQRKLLSINCIKNQNAIALSTVLIMDVSGSMSSGPNGVANIDLAILAAESWIKALPLGKSECALTSFDGNSYLIKDFTTNRQNLLDAVNLFKPQGGTNYDEALIEKMSSGLEITRKGQYKKVIVLLSDGLPNFEPKTNQIIAEANKQGCTIFCVTLGMPAPKSMIDMSRQTGGSYFENVTTLADAQKIYNAMLNTSLNNKPCEIIWESDFECNYSSTKLELTWMSDTSRVEYTPSIKSIPELNVSPNYVYFGLVEPNTTKDTTIIIKAIHSNFNITSIESKDSNTVFKVKSPQLPYYIRENETLRLNLSVQPKDSNIAYDYFEIKTDKCDTYLSAAAGELQRQYRKPTLKITSPNGGEKLVIGNNTDITWEGISPNDTVSIDYSMDNGATWKNITNKAIGHKYSWDHYIYLYNNLDTNVMIRVYQNYRNSSDQDTVKTISNYGRYGYLLLNNEGDKLIGLKSDSTYKKQIVILDLKLNPLKTSIDTLTKEIDYVALTSDNKYLYICSKDSTIKQWDAKTLKLVKTFKGQNKPVKYLVFDDSNKYFLAFGTDYVSNIWDVEKENKIKEISGNSGTIMNIDINFEKNVYATITFENKKRYLNIWDLASDSLKNRYANLNIEDYIRNKVLFISKNADRVIFGGEDSSITVIDINNGNILKKHKKYIIDHLAYDKENDIMIAQKWVLNAPLDIIHLPSGLILSRNNDFVERLWNGFTLNGNSSYLQYSNGPIKLWNLYPMKNLNYDLSDNSFKVILPQIQMKEIDMGSCEIGNVKDTMVYGSIYNPNEYSLEVDTINMGDNNFQIVSGMPPFTIQPKSYRNVEYRLKPTYKFNTNSYIYFIGNKVSYYQSIKGSAKEPKPKSISMLTKYIDFGKVRVGDSKDTMQVALIKNNSTAPIAIKKITQIGPNSTDFIISSSTGSFTLAPNETAKMNLKFNAKSKGRTNGNIIIDFADSIPSEMVQLFAEGVFEEDVCKGNGFDIRNFENNAQISKLGNTKLTSDSSIFLTESKSNNFGALVANDKISLLNSFVMKFAFRLSKGYNSFQDGSAAGADGLAVVFQGGKNFEVNAQGGGFGYSGLKNTVALELDLYRNKSEFNDPNGNHIAMQVPYQDITTAEHTANRTIAMNDSLFAMRADSTVYYALLRYSAENKRLEFYLDSNKNYENLVLSLDNFNFGKYLIFEKGGFASVGITSSTGASSQAHEILSWSLCSDGNEILSIENDYYNSEEIIQSGESISLKEGKITNVKMHDYLGKTLLSKEVNDKYFDLNSLNLANGVYFISITDELQRKYYRKISINK